MGGYPHTYMPPFVGQLPNNEPILGANLTNSVLMPELNDPEGKEKVNESSLEQTNDEKIQQKYGLLEEKLKVLEGDDNYGVIDATELSLVLDLVIPSKFKVPNFAKYGGTSCPKKHFTMYCKKMAGYIGNEKLLIHCFQDSLIRSAANWYLRLNRLHIQSWNDLTKAFVAHYRHVVDATPDRLSLQNLEQKSIESFNEYAQRWWDLAT